MVIVPKARRTSYNLAFKIKKVTEAEAVENNSEMASVSVWSVAGGRIKRTFSAVRLNCQRNGRRWDASRRGEKNLKGTTKYNGLDLTLRVNTL